MMELDQEASAHALLSAREAAKILCISSPTIRKMVREGRLTAIRTGKQGVYLFNKNSILKYLQEHPSETPIPEGKKRCYACKEIKSRKEFRNSSSNKDGKQTACATCQKLYQEKRKEKTPERIREVRVKSLYGITMKEYQVMLQEQNGVCAICKQLERRNQSKYLCVDHCHVTGAIRGLLCSNCNAVLGQIHEDPEIAKSLLEYIETKVLW